MGGPTLISYQNMVPANSNQMKSIQPLILFLYSEDEQNLEGEKKTVEETTGFLCVV